MRLLRRWRDKMYKAHRHNFKRKIDIEKLAIDMRDISIAIIIGLILGILVRVYLIAIFI